MKIRLTIAELFTLLDASYAPGKKGKTAKVGQLQQYKRELMQRYNLSKEDLARLKEALRHGKYSVLGGECLQSVYKMKKS